MEEEKRLGNRDKGWNDPPSFTYDKISQANTTPRKNLLNQRVAMPQNYMSPSATGSATPTAGLHSGHPPPTGPPPSTGPPPPSGSSMGMGPTRVIKDTPPPGKPLICDDGDGEMVSCDSAIASLRKVFELCQDKLQKRVISDVERRLKLLQDAWKNNKLSSPVQKRTAKLASELLARNYDSAHEIHLSLMVDHVSEVSQWMVGIKRLIHEARTILPHEKLEAGTSDVNSDKDRPRTIDQDPGPVPTAKGDAKASVHSPGHEDRECMEESRTVSKEEEAAKEMDNLDISHR